MSLTLINDQASASDLLDFTPYCKALCGIVNDPKTNSPLTVGIFGGWGTGKTSLMMMVMEDLAKSESSDRKNYCLWFNAWKYEREDALWRALLVSVVDKVKEFTPKDDEKAQSELKETEELLYNSIEREELGNLQFDWREFVKGGLETGTQILLASIPGINLATSVMEELGKSTTSKGPGKLLSSFQRARTQVKLAQIQSLDQFEKQFAKLINKYVVPKGRLIIFIDDLDRCLPTKTIEILEAIKLFLDVPGCVFFIGVDREIISKGIQLKYKDAKDAFDGIRYLEKIIQLAFELPPLEAQNLHKYIHALIPNLPDPRCETIFSIGLSNPNPRQVKRIINSYVFLSRLASERSGSIGNLSEIRLAKIIVIQHTYPELYSLLRLQPSLLGDLEDFFFLKNKEPDAATKKMPKILNAYSEIHGLEKLLLLFSDDKAASFRGQGALSIRPYFTLVKSVYTDISSQNPFGTLEPITILVPVGRCKIGLDTKDIEFLITNTDWAKSWLGKGGFKNETPSKILDIPGFYIGRYPISNLEYQIFVTATGYPVPVHWSGREAPEGLLQHPVVNVNYGDAKAYCEWLSSQTNKTYRLPTEEEWEKAARGETGLIYPWGNEYKDSHANIYLDGPGGTTPVGHYSPQGDSTYGCADMVGNVWEWCVDNYIENRFEKLNEPSTLRTVRGGAWNSQLESVRCTLRRGSYPLSRDNNLGFRVVLE